ncbi:beta-cyclopiazonate dehydrogenase [Rhypophila decipiens]
MNQLFKLAALAAPALAAVVLQESAAFRVIEKDVAIIGGGASGAYAAIRLKEDYGKSIVLVEKEAALGGHVDTMTDPDTGLPVDFGVAVFSDYGPARSFFERMNVTVGPQIRVTLANKYIDFTTGQTVNYTPASFPTGTLPAFQRFYNTIKSFESYLLPGYWNFPSAGKDIPADLLLPFGEFIKKYNLEEGIYMTFSTTGLGVGDMVNEMTLWVLAAFGQPMLEAMLGIAPAFQPVSGRNIEIYEAMAARLTPNKDVLYSSTVIQSVRSSALGVTLWVKNSVTGQITLIRAKKLLLAVEPTVDGNLVPFSLDTTEYGLLSKFEYTTIQAGVVSHPSLPAQTSLINIPASAISANGTDYTVLPGLGGAAFNARFDHIGGDSKLWRVLLVGPQRGFTNAVGQKLVKENLQKMIASGALPAGTTSEFEIKGWENHGVMHAKVSAKELKNGFFKKLYALQGRRSTFWTGGAFAMNFQAVLWAFDDVLLPTLVASL